MVTVVVSGYFDPLHKGHVELMKCAKALGDRLVVIVNNNVQTKNKKRYVFMDAEERMMIIKELKCVDDAILSIDTEQSVVETIKHLHRKEKIDIFANGGDRWGKSVVPEGILCDELGIHLEFNVGGEKIQSSSDLVKNSSEQIK